MSIQTLAAETKPMTTALASLLLNENDAACLAKAYAAKNIDPAFQVLNGARYYNKILGCEIWRFYMCSAHGPIGLLQIDAHSGKVVALSAREIQTMQERSAIGAAREQKVLPKSEDGFVLSEYARRCATAYLSDTLSLFFGAIEPVFVPGNPPRWRVTIEFKMYEVGPFPVGMIDIDAHNGDVLPLTDSQIKQIQERTSAIIGYQKSAATRG